MGYTNPKNSDRQNPNGLTALHSQQRFRIPLLLQIITYWPNKKPESEFNSKKHFKILLYQKMKEYNFYSLSLLKLEISTKSSSLAKANKKNDIPIFGINITKSIRLKNKKR